mmetsp:Transcript_90368/g.170372  ORF Transcript_90368/g.170372 Transcript_90368/m.170372 type:complete len:201 (-) Transcript_90368:78-680(-)
MAYYSNYNSPFSGYGGSVSPTPSAGALGSYGSVLGASYTQPGSYSYGTADSLTGGGYYHAPPSYPTIGNSPPTYLTTGDSVLQQSLQSLGSTHQSAAVREPAPRGADVTSASASGPAGSSSVHSAPPREPTSRGPNMQNSESMVAYPNYRSSQGGVAMPSAESMVAYPGYPGFAGGPGSGKPRKIRMYKSRRKKNYCYCV